MKQHLLFFIFCIVCAGTAVSQNWCPPGATWHYRNLNDGEFTYEDGTLELQYTTTVVINNVVCKEIKGTFYGADNWQDHNTYTVTNYVTYRTYENNNVVYIFNISSQQFDTIVNFSAHPGESWFSALNSSFCGDLQIARTKVTVYDTGHVVINSISLKKLVVSPPSAATQSVFIERIGGFPGFLFNWQDCALDGSTLGNFSCYQDDNFPVYKQAGVTDCIYYTVGIKEHNLADGAIKLYPNPNNGNFKLELQQAVKVQVFNTLGALVYEDNYESPGNYAVNISSIPAGLYYFKASNANGSGVVKIVKQ